MKVSEIIKNKKVTVSCELFPPKLGSKLPEAKKVVAEMALLKPDFMSVTYGAGGGTRQTTIDIADCIQNENGVPAIAHLTCVSSDTPKIEYILTRFKELGIKNILALRGDIPENSDVTLPDEYQHANDLVDKIKSFGDFCVGGACYPEGHPESSTLEADIENLKRKVDSGCEFLTTQMFFDNNILYSYLLKLLRAGINIPIIAGIMPITNTKQLQRTCSLSGSIVPRRFKAIADRFGDSPEAMKQAGIAYATDQIIDLIANGVNNIHIYTMNHPDVAGKIMDNLSTIIR